ncbi:uncharacterized protein LOC126979348 [Leptidea sinapis]|uniref:uncharacterized protein LOC126979348 n=1 Tax=Leptidea sinapis TaxID=189913 RepID=UPI0021C2DAC4|nr:uncharacterized protein LOC126979348 [Leptidea sinapis]
MTGNLNFGPFGGPSSVITKVLARNKNFVSRKLLEVTEKDRRPNFNRDKGLALPPTWKPVLQNASRNKTHSADDHVVDVVSTVCAAVDTNSKIMSVIPCSSSPSAHPESPPVQPRSTSTSPQCRSASMDEHREARLQLQDVLKEVLKRKYLKPKNFWKLNMQDEKYGFENGLIEDPFMVQAYGFTIVMSSVHFAIICTTITQAFNAKHKLPVQTSEGERRARRTWLLALHSQKYRTRF